MPNTVDIKNATGATVTVDTQGTAITGQSLETGGYSAMGWLSSIRKAITDSLASLLARLPAALGGAGGMKVEVLSIAAGSATLGNVGFVAQTAGGWLTAQDIDLDEASPANVKASAGKVHGWILYNAHLTAVRYVKLYNKASAPVLASDTPFITIPVPPASLAHELFETGIAFPTGIGWAATTGVPVNDAGAPGANDVQAVLFYI